MARFKHQIHQCVAAKNHVCLGGSNIMNIAIGGAGGFSARVPTKFQKSGTHAFARDVKALRAFSRSDCFFI